MQELPPQEDNNPPSQPELLSKVNPDYLKDVYGSMTATTLFTLAEILNKGWDVIEGRKKRVNDVKREQVEQRKSGADERFSLTDEEREVAVAFTLMTNRLKAEGPQDVKTYIKGEPVRVSTEGNRMNADYIDFDSNIDGAVDFLKGLDTLAKFQ
jgi:hypothetical protein